jgi:hypothetical protein
MTTTQLKLDDPQAVAALAEAYRYLRGLARKAKEQKTASGAAATPEPLAAGDTRPESQAA